MQNNLDPKYELGKVAFAPLSDEVKKKIFGIATRKFPRNRSL